MLNDRFIFSLFITFALLPLLLPLGIVIDLKRRSKDIISLLFFDRDKVGGDVVYIPPDLRQIRYTIYKTISETEAYVDLDMLRFDIVRARVSNWYVKGTIILCITPIYQEKKVLTASGDQMMFTIRMGYRKGKEEKGRAYSTWEVHKLELLSE